MPYVTEDNLTDLVLERWKDIPDPRLRQTMQSLIKHLHGVKFFRRPMLEISINELTGAQNFLTPREPHVSVMHRVVFYFDHVMRSAGLPPKCVIN
jgi:hypothetical protein